MTLNESLAATPQYRLIVRGDIIERGDEWLQDDAVTWEPTPAIFVGMEYMHGVMLPGRRKLTPNVELTRADAGATEETGRASSASG